MELKDITEHVAYIPNAANIGLIQCSERAAILIDSGPDKETAEKVAGLVDSQNMTIRAVINTHSHADHIGGNAYLKEQAWARIYCPEIESSLIENTILEPSFLFSGAMPPSMLQNRFLYAQGSEPDYVIKKGEKKLWLHGVELEIVELPGHALNQIGIAYEGVLFCADALFPEAVLAKHKIPFLVDSGTAQESLAKLKDSDYSWYVPGHGEMTNSIKALAQANMAIITAVEQEIVEQLSRGMLSTEALLKCICTSKGIVLRDLQQYCLLHTTINGYLGSLQRAGKIQTTMQENTLFWQAA